MDTFERHTTTLTTEGLAFKEATIPIIKPCPFDLQMNEQYAYEEVDYKVGLKSLKRKFISSLITKNEGFLYDEAILKFIFKDGGQITIKPCSTPYLDADIRYEKLGIKYNPKVYADVSSESPNTFEKCSTEGVGENAAIKNLAVESFTVYSHKPLGDARDTMKKPARVVKLEGTVYFDRMSYFVYENEENVKMSIYPDILHQCINLGPSEKNRDYHMEIE